MTSDMMRSSRQRCRRSFLSYQSIESFPFVPITFRSGMLKSRSCKCYNWQKKVRMYLLIAGVESGDQGAPGCRPICICCALQRQLVSEMPFIGKHY